MFKRLRFLNPLNWRPKKPLIKMLPRDVMMLCIGDLDDLLPGGNVNRVCAVLLVSADDTIFQARYHLFTDNTMLTTLETDLYAVSSLPDNVSGAKAATIAIRRHISDIRGTKNVS